MSTTTVFWNVLDNGVPYLQPWAEDESEARAYLSDVTGPLVCRPVIFFPDIVGSTYTVPNTYNRDRKQAPDA